MSRQNYYNNSNSGRSTNGRAAGGSVDYSNRGSRESGSYRTQQNAEAVVRNINQNKAVLREGKHAAAVDQLHENDLHGIETYNRKPEGLRGDPSRPDYPDQKFSLHHRPRVRQDPAYQDTELTTSFDPMKDRHLWAMWRTAVNGRIVDAVRRKERNKVKDGPEPEGGRGLYGQSIVAPPLSRFIKLQDGSREIAQVLSNEGQGQLQTSQFVFYGLPRVYMERGPPQ